MWVCRKLLETGVVQPQSANHILSGEHGLAKVCCVSITKATVSSFAVSDLHYKQQFLSFIRY